MVVATSITKTKYIKFVCYCNSTENLFYLKFQLGDLPHCLIICYKVLYWGQRKIKSSALNGKQTPGAS